MYVHSFILWKFGLKVANVKKEDNLSKVFQVKYTFFILTVRHILSEINNNDCANNNNLLLNYNHQLFYIIYEDLLSIIGREISVNVINVL